jgi:hypothetical protein
MLEFGAFVLQYGLAVNPDVSGGRAHNVEPRQHLSCKKGIRPQRQQLATALPASESVPAP